MTSPVLALAITDEQLVHTAFGAVVGLLGLLLAIIGYFLKLVHEQVQEHDDKLDRHSVEIARLEEGRDEVMRMLEGVTNWLRSIDEKLDDLKREKKS